MNLCQHSSNSNDEEKQRKDATTIGGKNVCVKLSRLEFHEAALQYGILKPKTHNIKLTSRNFKRYDDTTMVTSISVSRSHFHGKADVIGPITSASCSNLANRVVQKNSTDQSDGYNFRKRKRSPENLICAPAKRHRALVVRNEIKPKLIVANKELLTEGLIVLAQMRTYAAWPAKINGFGKTYVNVHFFGDNTTGNVPFGNVGIFTENYQLIKLNLKKKNSGYVKAVQCVERLLEIPNHLSLIN